MGEETGKGKRSTEIGEDGISKDQCYYQRVTTRMGDTRVIIIKLRRGSQGVEEGGRKETNMKVSTIEGVASPFATK